MSKQSFIPNHEEDLNRKHNVTLTEGQISTILYILEGYIDPTNDNSYDPDCREDIDNIFEVLEGVIDNYYDKDNATKVTRNQLKSIKGNLLWTDQTCHQFLIQKNTNYYKQSINKRRMMCNIVINLIGQFTITN